MFHAIIWTVFYKYVHEKNVTEHVLSLAVYLLEMALSLAPKVSSPTSLPVFQQVNRYAFSSVSIECASTHVWRCRFVASVEGDAGDKPCYESEIGYLVRFRRPVHQCTHHHPNHRDAVVGVPTVLRERRYVSGQRVLGDEGRDEW